MTSDELTHGKTLRDMTEQEAYEALIREDFVKEAAMLASGMDRRTFLKLMGASLAAAGFGLSGCASTAPPDEEIVPYVRMPEEVIPGVPLYFASSMVLGGYASGILIETHQGRPTRIEGNPQHPASLGSADARTQASFLDLYSPDRSTIVLNEGRETTWDEFIAAFGALDLGDGSGIRVLTETVTSPTLAAQLNGLMEFFPGSRWYQYEPVNLDNVVAGAELAFGEALDTVYRFNEATCVLSLDADFMSEGPGSVRYARDMIASRQVRVGEDQVATMARLYVVESTATNTGAAADHRLALKAGNVALFTQALAAALGVEGVEAPASVPWSNAFFNAVVEDLQANGSTALVVPGYTQPPAVHALAHAINAQLGGVGTTLEYIPSVAANPGNQAGQLAELVADMNAGRVDALLIVEGNPVYTALNDIDFAAALDSVPFSMHLSLYNDETSTRCTWQIPAAHFVEQWSDARAFDGTASVLQPPIGPLYPDVRTAHEMVALFFGDTRSSFEIVRGVWRSQLGDDFDGLWRSALHDGLVEGTAFEPVQPTLQAFAADLAITGAADGLELNFRPDPTLYDGRFANNTWLQELPHPITKIAWDTAALLSTATAEALGVTDGDLLDLTFNGVTQAMPVWIVPIQPDDTVTLNFGYGRGLSADVEEGFAFNAFTLRHSETTWFGSGLEAAATGDDYNLVSIRGQFNIDEEVTAIHAGTLANYLEDPFSVHGSEQKKIYNLLTDTEYNGYAWGMTIDLTSCIGCNACMIGCQMENNIPTVGKAEVARQREMNWIRVDRYYEPDDNGNITTHFQPVACVQCENAPCELVCPVHATVHDTEGINNMIYGRCIGTRYCSANCPTRCAASTSSTTSTKRPSCRNGGTRTSACAWKV
ncbi:molybdopterin oxidoreductase [bacterium]|nr:molybdopterin oxidoreductase [bacterium]